MKSFAPNPPPTYGESIRTCVRFDFQRLSDLFDVGSEHLQRTVDGHVVAIPLRDGGMGLHGRRLLTWSGVDNVECDFRIAHGAVEIALFEVRGRCLAVRRTLRLVEALLELQQSWCFVIDRSHQLGCLPGGFEGFRDHEREWLTGVDDFRGWMLTVFRVGRVVRCGE